MPTLAQIQDLSSAEPSSSASSISGALSSSNTMPVTRHQMGRSKRAKRGKGVKRSKTTIRKGKVHVKLSKHRTVALAPSQLVRYMPLNKMKAAAKSIIRSSTVTGRRRARKN